MSNKNYVSLDRLEIFLDNLKQTFSKASHTHKIEDITDFKTDYLPDIVYPIGSIYISTTNTSPASLFGGTWEQIQDTFLLAAGSGYIAGSVGGESTHTLTIDEMPSHTHTYKTTAWVNKIGDIVDNNNSEYIDYGINRQTQATGGSQPHNNMPPYLAVYMWKRVK